jgi:prolipoprotein diacylglyceryltransferase
MKSGKIFFTFLILSSLARGWLELFRAEVSPVLSIPLATLVSVAIAAGAIIALYYFQIRDYREDIKAILSGVFGLNKRILRRTRF